MVRTALVVLALLHEGVRALRFQISDRVECHLDGDVWEAGTVIRIQVEHGNGVAPYLVQLDSGSSVVAPLDDDRYIRKEGSAVASYSARMLRFAVGTRVEANMGMYWARGIVSGLNPWDQSRGRAAPYRIRLDLGGEEVFAPEDDDAVVRKAGQLQMVDPALRFGVGDRVECLMRGEDGVERWSAGVVVALRYHEPRFGKGVTMPYQVKLDDGDALIFSQRDDDASIRRSPPGESAVDSSTRDPSRPAGRSQRSGKSKIAKRQVQRKATAMGGRTSGSKVSKSKLGGGVPSARTHESALPPPRNYGLAAWQAITDMEL